MAIYDKPVRLLMREMASDLAPKADDVITKQQVLSWFRDRYPKIKEGTVTAHLIRLSTNAPSRLHYHAKAGDDDLFFQIDGNRYRRYNPVGDAPPIHEGTTPPALLPTDSEADLPDSAAEFAYEADLRNFLAKNLSLIESGLRLYEEESISGIEFPVGGRFIDILALDTSNNYVVIELKVSKGYDRVVGQLLRYTAWIAKHHAEPSQSVRGVIVAREISDDLLLACSGLPHIQLFEYQLAVSLKHIKR
jgi:hypothetical protein